MGGMPAAEHPAAHARMGLLADVARMGAATEPLNASEPGDASGSRDAAGRPARRLAAPRGRFVAGEIHVGHDEVGRIWVGLFPRPVPVGVPSAGVRWQVDAVRNCDGLTLRAGASLQGFRRVVPVSCAPAARRDVGSQ